MEFRKKDNGCRPSRMFRRERRQDEEVGRGGGSAQASTSSHVLIKLISSLHRIVFM